MSKGNHRRRAGRGEGISTSGSGLSESQNQGHRHARLERVLAEELNALLRDELRDPALESVGFTGVELSVDYRTARVRFALRNNPNANTGTDAFTIAERALERATPFLRGRLIDALELKRIPNLRFVPDRDGVVWESVTSVLLEEDPCE